MNFNHKIRVLVVDDLALARKILRDSLSQDAQIEVIGTARTPSIALSILASERPDVITLDIELPEMDGVSFMKSYMRQYPTPTIIVSSLAERGQKITLDALEAGAFGVVTKPKVGIVDGLPALMDDLCELVKDAARSDAHHSSRLTANETKIQPKPAPGPLRDTFQPTSLDKTTDRVIAIGASAGGVSTLARLLPMFPATSPGIVIVQHMPAGFTASFAERLNTLCTIQVKEAEDGDRVRPGLALLAPGGNRQLEIHRSGGEYRVVLFPADKVNGHCPAVDVLFHSIARNVGKNAAAALLTGMGNDGAAGLLEIRQSGGHTFAQDEETSIIFGMPGAAWEIGAAEKLLPIDAVAGYLLRALQ